MAIERIEKIVNRYENCDDIYKVLRLSEAPSNEQFLMFYINKQIRNFVYRYSYSDVIDTELLYLANDEPDLDYWYNNVLPLLIEKLSNSLVHL